VSDLPEPADRRLLRVSDADRDQVAEVLREAAGTGRLTLEELDERLDLAYAAKTYADLEAVTRDLPAAGHGAPAPGARAGLPPRRVGGTPGASFSLAIMSGAQRKGSWVVPRTYTAVAIMGGVELDLRWATFSEPEATIHAYALMGGISIVVPEDIEVDVGGFAFMGGFDHVASGPGTPGAPRLRIIGFALMGGVDVRRKPADRRPEGGRRELGDRRDRELEDRRD
jgi:DUF1707 SHOCT-like domain/Cell wall-active antibiotics response LiaF, C-terminal